MQKYLLLSTLILVSCMPLNFRSPSPPPLPTPFPISMPPQQHPSWRTFEKPSDDILRSTLTPLAYEVTQQEGTEPPFSNAYWDQKNEGIYVDIVSGEPLFSSKDKYDSGTGWPSFTKAIAEGHVTTHKDRRLFTERTEVRSALANSHLGHVFQDGPKPLGLRYCMNSSALRFIPRNMLQADGYEEYLGLFE